MLFTPPIGYLRSEERKMSIGSIRKANLQFFDIVAFAKSFESPIKDTRLATSFGPLSSSTEGAELDTIKFLPRVHSTNN